MTTPGDERCIWRSPSSDDGYCRCVREPHTDGRHRCQHGDVMQTTPGDEHADLREQLARALGYARGEGWAWDNGRVLEQAGKACEEYRAMHRRLAEGHLLPVVTAHTDAALAEERRRVWDDGWVTGMGDAVGLSNNTQTTVTPNPYAADIVREVGGS